MEKVLGFYCPYSGFTRAIAFALVRYKGITWTKIKNQTVYAGNKAWRQLSVQLFWGLLRERRIFPLLETLSVGLDVNRAAGRGEASSSTGEVDLDDLRYLLFLSVLQIGMIEISHLSKQGQKTRYDISDPQYIWAPCYWSQQCISCRGNREWMGFAYMDSIVLLWWNGKIATKNAIESNLWWLSGYLPVTLSILWVSEHFTNLNILFFIYIFLFFPPSLSPKAGSSYQYYMFERTRRVFRRVGFC